MGVLYIYIFFLNFLGVKYFLYMFPYFLDEFGSFLASEGNSKCRSFGKR